jgi:hypothetical protein
MFAKEISSQNEIKENSGPHVQFIQDWFLKANALYAVNKRIEMYFFSTSDAYKSSKMTYEIKRYNSNV